MVIVRRFKVTMTLEVPEHLTYGISESEQATNAENIVKRVFPLGLLFAYLPELPTIRNVKAAEVDR